MTVFLLSLLSLYVSLVVLGGVRLYMELGWTGWDRDISVNGRGLCNGYL